MRPAAPASWLATPNGLGVTAGFRQAQSIANGAQPALVVPWCLARVRTVVSQQKSYVMSRIVKHAKPFGVPCTAFWPEPCCLRSYAGAFSR